MGALSEQWQAMRYLAALFLSGVGLNTIAVNLTRFVTHVLGVSDGDAVQPFLILTQVMGLVTVPATRLARRIGPKWVITGGMVLIAVAAGAALVVQTTGQAMLVLLLAGAGMRA